MNNDNLEEKSTGQRTDPAAERLQNIARGGLNTATGGAWNRVRNAPIIGNAAKNAENNLADKIGNSRLGKKINNTDNHQRPDLGVQNKEEENNPNNSKNGDVGKRNLQNSLANKAKNLLNQRKKNKKDKKGENSEDKDKDNATENKETNDSTESSEDKNDSPLDDIKGNIQRIRRIKLVIKIVAISVIIFMAVVIVLSLIMAVTGINLAKSIPAIGVTNYETDEFQSTYEKGTSEYKKEIEYYEKLKSVKKEYDNSHEDELKTSYIHAILLYKYYTTETHDKNDKGEEIPIDFSKMTQEVDTVISLMKSNEEDGHIDYEKKGELYNNLKDSSDFRKYYEELLKDRNIDEVLDEIFDFAEELEETESGKDETVVTKETKVAVTSSSSSTSTKTTTNSKTLTINEYLADSIYATTNSITNSELVKAYTITYSTNIASQNKNLTINANNASMSNETCSTKLGCSFNKEGKLVDGKGEQSDKNTLYYNGGYYYKKPLTDEESKTLNNNINNVFGNVLVNSDGTYPSLDVSKITGLGEGDYKSILNSSYGSSNLKNIGENSYILDASYGDKKVLTTVKFYDQSDYSGYSFCGLKRETIASSGCGITSMAIVVSTYENNTKYNPIWTNDIAKQNGQCGAGRGTDYSHFKYVAKKMGYKSPIFYTKSKANKWVLPKTAYNNVLKHLAKGDLVIINVSKGHFTGGGHYMVLGGVDPETKKVYVYDTNNKSNSRYRNTGNGWWSFNDIIVPETKSFIIIEKKG